MSNKALRRPRNAAYLIVGVWVVAVIVFAIVERVTDPKSFPTIWLAFWWAVQTVTTVGYGDVVPDQTAGKVMAAILMLGGLAFIAIITATITSAFVERRQAEARASGEDPVTRELARIAEKLDQLESALAGQRDGDEAPPPKRVGPEKRDDG